MHPAACEVVQYLTVPDSAATAGDLFADIRSLPWCAPPGRGAPKSSTYVTCPTTGKMMWSGTFGVTAAAGPAARPSMTARKRTPRAVVRWRLIRGDGRSGARSRGRRLAGLSAPVESAPHEDRRLREA